MRTIIILFILGLTSTSWAILPPPPVIKDVPTQQYLKYLYDEHNIFPITTTAPNGSRYGKVGEIVIYNNVGTYTAWVNTDGDTTWSQL